MIVKRREDLLTALQCSVLSLSLSPDLDLEFKTFSIFPLQTQIGAPGGGTWPAGTSNQSPAAVKFSVQDSSSSFQLAPRSVSSCPVSDHRSALVRSRFYCVKTRRSGHTGHTALAPALILQSF